MDFVGTIHYPHQLGLSGPSTTKPTDSPAQPSPTKANIKGSRSGSLRRSASLFSDEAQSTLDQAGRPEHQRTYSTLAPSVKPSQNANNATLPPHPLSILSLDLKLGHPSAPTASLPALLPSLSLATLSQLLSRRLTSSLGHISSLRARVIDTSSRILVTGDLNAGKSTLVNALLRREVMPSDQQPCTTTFCEVLDSTRYNHGKEEIHAIRDLAKYDTDDAGTYEVYSLAQVQEVQDKEDEYEILRAYVHDERAPVVAADEEVDETANPSFIKNGLVSTSLIDAPGLNRDTLSTTAVFAQQSEIDVIVFVVSAENHFTLSAKEFLWNASREKAYVFIVVNKWAAIKDKARCMRLVGEQIKQLSPATWEAKDELVHFVDAAEVLGQEEDEVDEDGAFEHLEQSLRSFVLLKRSKSKLAPAKHYLLNLLSDLAVLAEANVAAARTELTATLEQLDLVKPVHERLSAQRDEVEDGVDRVEETVVDSVRTRAWARLEAALGYVSEGQVVPAAAEPAPSLCGGDRVTAPTELPAYPGVLGLWDWAADVKRTLVRALEAEVRAAEDEARAETVGGVEKVMTGLGDKYLPSDKATGSIGEAAAANERVFRPEVMFAKRRRGVGRLAAHGVSTGLGLGAAGLGLGWTATDFDVSFLDLFDLEHVWHSANGTSRKSRKGAEEDDALETGALVSLGVGSIGMIGSRLIGIKGTLASVTRALEVLGSPEARKWAGPVIGVLTAGLVAYVVLDLPRAVPRNIGRKLEAALSASPSQAVSAGGSSAGATQPPVSFSSAHADRIGRETRKVLRLAGWDLRERFRAALERSAAERRQVEATVAKCEGAMTFLSGFADRVELEEDRVDAVELEA